MGSIGLIFYLIYLILEILENKVLVQITKLASFII
jgi:hypothetical protein